MKSILAPGLMTLIVLCALPISSYPEEALLAQQIGLVELENNFIQALKDSQSVEPLKIKLTEVKRVVNGMQPSTQQKELLTRVDHLEELIKNHSQYSNQSKTNPTVTQIITNKKSPSHELVEKIYQELHNSPGKASTDADRSAGAAGSANGNESGSGGGADNAKDSPNAQSASPKPPMPSGFGGGGGAGAGGGGGGGGGSSAFSGNASNLKSMPSNPFTNPAASSMHISPEPHFLPNSNSSTAAIPFTSPARSAEPTSKFHSKSQGSESSPPSHQQAIDPTPNSTSENSNPSNTNANVAATAQTTMNSGIDSAPAKGTSSSENSGSFSKMSTRATPTDVPTPGESSKNNSVLGKSEPIGSDLQETAPTQGNDRAPQSVGNSDDYSYTYLPPARHRYLMSSEDQTEQKNNRYLLELLLAILAAIATIYIINYSDIAYLIGFSRHRKSSKHET